MLSVCDRLKSLFQEIEILKANPLMEDESLGLIELLKRENELLNSKPVPKKRKAAFEIFDEEVEVESKQEEPVADNADIPIEVILEKVNLLQKKISTQTDKGLSQVKKEIKVSNEKLDQLMDIMGELVIAESNVTQHSAIKQIKNDSFGQSLNRLRKIVLDLQEVVLSTRMIPISPVFQRMSRLVRDL